MKGSRIHRPLRQRELRCVVRPLRQWSCAVLSDPSVSKLPPPLCRGGRYAAHSRCRMDICRMAVLPCKGEVPNGRRGLCTAQPIHSAADAAWEVPEGRRGLYPPRSPSSPAKGRCPKGGGVSVQRSQYTAQPIHRAAQPCGYTQTPPSASCHLPFAGEDAMQRTADAAGIYAAWPSSPAKGRCPKGGGVYIHPANGRSGLCTAQPQRAEGSIPPAQEHIIK